LAPPGIPELERRLQRRGSDDKETIQKRLEIAQQELEHSKAEEGFYDKIIVNDDLEMAYKQLENYIFGIEEDNEEPSVLTVGDEKENPAQVASTEVEMVDGELPAGYSSKIDGSGGDNAKAIAANANKIRESVAAEMETS
jgi:THO complex subunit 1